MDHLPICVTFAIDLMLLEWSRSAAHFLGPSVSQSTYCL